MQTSQKFIFDTDFKAQADPTPAPKPEDLALAFEEGREQGQRDAQARLEAEGHATLSAIRTALELSVTSLQSEIERVEQEAIKLATELVRVYTAAALTRDPEPVIAALVKKAARAAGNIPILSIYVGPTLTEQLRHTIEKAIADAGFSGRVSLLEDRSLTTGDVRLEWPDGGFKHSRNDLDLLIDRLIETHSPSRTDL